MVIKSILIGLISIPIVIFLIFLSPFACKINWVKRERELNQYAGFWKTWKANMKIALWDEQWFR